MEVEYDNMLKNVEEMYSFFPPVKEQVHHVNVKKRKNRKSKGKSSKNKKKVISENGKNKKE